MNPETRRRWHYRLRPVLGAVMLAFSAASQGQADGCAPGRQVTGGALDEVTYRQLNAVYEAVGEERYDEAFGDLQRLLGRAGRDDYLLAVINQAMAQVEWSRGNFDNALRYFETAVELDALPNQAHFALMYQLAHLYYMQERYVEALERLEVWFCTAAAETITSSAWVLRASIHRSMGNYPRALEAIGVAIGMAQEPQEPWYQLKLALLFELKQFLEAVETLELMVAYWPAKKTYWVQLSQIYLNLEQNDRALAVMAVAYREGLLDSAADLESLSSLYALSGVPYRSAEVLQRGIEDGVVDSNRENWARVADHWYNAEELQRALFAYERAGRESTDGEIDLRRGYILVDLERWQEARSALDAAIGRGGLAEARLGEAYLLRGMAQFNLGNFDEAGADWGRAGSYDRTRRAAEQWMAHLRDERRRGDL